MMTQIQLMRIANEADMIVRGYAFTRSEDGIRVLNLNHPDSAILLAEDGTMLETNMDGTEQHLVQRLWQQNAEFMEAGYAKVHAG